MLGNDQFLFSTEGRQRILINIKNKDVDLNNNVGFVTVTNNKKSLVVSLKRTTADIRTNGENKHIYIDFYEVTMQIKPTFYELKMIL